MVVRLEEGEGGGFLYLSIAAMHFELLEFWQPRSLYIPRNCGAGVPWLAFTMIPWGHDTAVVPGSLFPRKVGLRTRVPTGKLSKR